MKKRICVLTTTRAEFGLLYWLMKEIDADQDLQLQVMVTGMHLSPRFGLTYQEIEKDGFVIDSKIPVSLEADQALDVVRAMGEVLVKVGEELNRLQPDCFVVLGDRYELLAAVSAALICKIPVAHLCGGDVTQGAFDDSIRHSVTKMAHLHFPTTDEYRQRIIQLGEAPDRVFNFGHLGVENVLRFPLMDKPTLEKALDFSLEKPTLLITFHPETLAAQSPGEQFGSLLKALKSLDSETQFLFTMPNADPNSKIIEDMIHQFVRENPFRAKSFVSLGPVRYLSCMQFVEAIVGNSSSGILEVASFQKAAINIGNRQKGRLSAENVIHCDCDPQSIEAAFRQMRSEEFRKKLLTVVNPYGQGIVSPRIVKVLKETDFGTLIPKKFYP